MAKCKACGYEFKHEYEYKNSEAGILICQECAYKITKHFVEGWAALAVAEGNLAKQTLTFVERIEKRFKPR